MNQAQPIVTIIIPCYNQGKFLGESIDSALKQTYPHVQVIVVDDGSTDTTPEVARSYGDRIRLIRKENEGRAVARNTGILEAEGDWLLFLDSDDYLRLDAVEKHIEALSARPSGVVFHSGWQSVDISGKVFNEDNPQPLDTDPFHGLIAGLCPHVGAVMVQRSVFATAGIFDERVVPQEDWDMWLRLAAAGCEFVSVRGSLSTYRRHPGSTTLSSSARMARQGLAVLSKSTTYHADCRRCRVVRMRAFRDWKAALRRARVRELMVATRGRRAWVRAAQVVCEGSRNPSLAIPIWNEASQFLRHKLVKS